ncbi:anthranilate synthase component I family protein [Candidatus Uabimicrobium sp. HlEnr_7]|uniref:anthranilate synthase component I family protein n=1 Tax=Candidatus Uabimicrobium helgolandensis TaxID=3095367 RepID=UPI003556F0FC
MKKYPLHCRVKKILADTVTPVSIYLRLRDLYSHCFLLESVDFQPNKKSFSYICCDPIAEFKVHREKITQRFPDGSTTIKDINERTQVSKSLQDFITHFSCTMPEAYSFIDNGLFGYTAYDAIRYFETIDVQHNNDIPDMIYHVFRYVIAIDHHRNEMFIVSNDENSDLASFVYTLTFKDFPQYAFRKEGPETSNLSDEEFIDCVCKCKQHVKYGDVFQIVPSRRFAQKFSGDEFNVYRALRSINPSPYLFYFDYGNFKILGSSPEAQLTVKDGKASLYPIAGTYRRTGDEKADLEAVEKLRSDPKENAEHVMLVDLARNDLNKHCEKVEVENYREAQMYSHVIHLTSKVSGRVKNATVLDILHDTFPMGTLSGAPKYRAIELINTYENVPRHAYGGAIGCLGFNGSCNHAIVIRSFVSYQQTLYFQAGAGIVADSVPEKELQEVNNKLGALKKALDMAEEISNDQNTCTR